LRLKGSLGKRFPYKDTRGSWQIQVFFDTSIRVVHTKLEQSFEDNSFQFKWSLEMVFDTELEHLDMSYLRVLDITFGTADSEKRKQEILDTLNWCKNK